MFWKNQIETFTIFEKPTGTITPVSRELYFKYYNKNPIVYKAINFISLHLSKFKIIGNDTDSQNFIKNPIYNDKNYLFHNFIYRLTTELLIYGDVLLIRNKNSLEFINIKKILIIANDNEEIIQYKINDKIYNQSEIIHIKYGSNKIYGISPLSPAQNAIETYSAISNYILGLIQSGGRPSGILSIPSGSFSIDKQDNINKIKNLYNRMGNHCDIAIIDNKIEWQKIGEDSKNLELLEKKAFAEKEILGCFNLQPILLDLSLGSATFSNYEIAVKQLKNDILIPLLNKILETISAGLYGKNLLSINEDQ